jgi:thiol-disulfide isomerase/thioredoxin
MLEEKGRCLCRAIPHFEGPMNRKKWTIFAAIASNLVVFLGLVTLVQAAEDPAPEIAWVTDLNEGMQLAKIHNKPLMLHFYGDHCPPCRMLDAKAFRNRDLILALNDNVIAVKINADRRRDVAQNYQVTRWPTDVFLHADGTVIERGVSNQDPQAYARTVARVAQRHRDWALAQVASREAKERQERHVATRDLSLFRSKIFSQATKQKTPVKVSSAEWKRDEPAPEKIATQRQRAEPERVQVIDVAAQLREPSNSTTDPALHSEDQRAQQLDALASIPGLDGFCPVSLQDYLKLPPEAQATQSPWVPGKEAYSVRHRGRVYQCVSEEARQRLLREPDGFAPIFSGLDLVEFARSGQFVNGRCEFGFIEQNSGRIFLFSAQTHHDEFLRNCEQYSALVESNQDRVAHERNSTQVR